MFCTDRKFEMQRAFKDPCCSRQHLEQLETGEFLPMKEITQFVLVKSKKRTQAKIPEALVPNCQPK